MKRLHNAHWLGTGYDLLEVDPLDSKEGRKRRVVTFEEWIEDAESGVSRPVGTRYRPDPRMQMSSSSTLLITSSDFQTKFGSDFKLDASGKRRGVKASFGFSHSLKKVMEETRATGQLVSHSEAVERVGEIYFEGLASDQAKLDEPLLPGELLTAEFRAAVEALPQKRNFAWLVEQWGTHFSSHVAIGGRAFSQVVIEVSSYSYMRSQGVDVQLAATGSFQKKFSGKMSEGIQKEWVQKFEQQSGVKSQELIVNGGQYRDTLRDWSATVKDDAHAVPVELTLTRLSRLLTNDFFPDLPGIDGLRRDLDAAIDASLARFPEPRLTIRYADTFETKGAWTDKGSKGNVDCGWYLPVPPPGYHVLSYLHYEHENDDYKDPPHGLALLAKATDDAADGELFCPPEQWMRRHFRDWWGNQGTFWLPIAPQGYRALGMIALKGDPSPQAVASKMHRYRCVRKDLVADAHYGPCIWYSKGVGKNPVAIWPIVPDDGKGVAIGGWVAYNTDPQDLPDFGKGAKAYPRKVLDANTIWPLA